jgi:hypothetical protein
MVENLRPPSHRLRQLHDRRPILPLRAPGRDLEKYLCVCGGELCGAGEGSVWYVTFLSCSNFYRKAYPLSLAFRYWTLAVTD